MRTRVSELGAPARLIAFAIGLALLGGAAAIAGAATGNGHAPGTAGGGDAMAMAQLSPAEQSQASGLASVAGGYALVPAETTLTG